MYYVVANGTAYALDNPDAPIYGADVLSDGSIDWVNAYDIVWEVLDDEEREYVAHVAYHLQQVAKLSEEHQEVFVK
jgi:hypothetical protein